MMRYRSIARSLFIAVLCCTLPDSAAAQASPEKTESKHTPGTTKGIVDIEKFDRPDDATQLVGPGQHILVQEAKRGTDWTFEDGVLTASTRGGESLLTPAKYQDFVMHLDFNVNHDPEQSRAGDGNSGVYIQ